MFRKPLRCPLNPAGQEIHRRAEGQQYGRARKSRVSVDPEFLARFAESHIENLYARPGNLRGNAFGFRGGGQFLAVWCPHSHELKSGMVGRDPLSQELLVGFRPAQESHPQPELLSLLQEGKGKIAASQSRPPVPGEPL